LRYNYQFSIIKYNHVGIKQGDIDNFLIEKIALPDE
jgi:hypothetical protein